MEFKLPFNFKLTNQDLTVKNQKVPTYNPQMLNNALTIMGADGNTYIENGYQKNPHLYAIIRLILREAVKADLILYELEADKGTPSMKRKLRNRPETFKNVDKMEVGEHDLLKLLYNPNEVQGKAAFLEAVLGYKLITGRSHVHQLWPETGPNKGIPKQLYSLASPLVSIKYDQFGAPKEIEVKVGNKKTKLDPQEVISFNYFNPVPGDNTGQSPIMAARGAVAQSNDAYTANMKILQNAGASGILTYTSNPGDTFDVKKQQKLENKYYQRYGGVDNYGRIMVTNAAVKWEQIGLAATDLALMEAQEMTKRDLCNIYGVSSQLLNDTENSTYNNVKEARRELISNVVLPELQAFIDELNRVLVPKYEARDNKKYLLAIDTSVYPELKEDEKQLAEVLSKAHWLSTNEKRTRMGEDEREGDEYNEILVPSSMVPIGTTDELLLQRAFSASQKPAPKDEDN